MSNPRTIRIIANISITEQEQETVELTSVLGQNVPEVMMDLLANGPVAGWRLARANVYAYAVPNTQLTIEVDGSNRPHITVVVRSLQIVPEDQQQQARQILREEIRAHQVECNRIFNQLVNDSIQEAILRMGQRICHEQGLETKEDVKWTQELNKPQERRLRLRVRMRA